MFEIAFFKTDSGKFQQHSAQRCYNSLKFMDLDENIPFKTQKHVCAKFGPKIWCFDASREC